MKLAESLPSITLFRNLTVASKLGLVVLLLFSGFVVIGFAYRAVLDAQAISHCSSFGL